MGACEVQVEEGAIVCLGHSCPVLSFHEDMQWRAFHPTQRGAGGPCSRAVGGPALLDLGVGPHRPRKC